MRSMHVSRLAGASLALPCLLLAGSLGCHSVGSREPGAPPAQRWQPLFTQAAQVVRGDMGVRLETLELRAATLEEMTDSVLREISPGALEDGPKDEDANRLRRLGAEALSRAMFARYSPERKVVLIRPEA